MEEPYSIELVGSGEVYVRVRRTDAKRTLEWVSVKADTLDEAIKVAEQMPDVEVCLEASFIPGGVIT